MIDYIFKTKRQKKNHQKKIIKKYKTSIMLILVEVKGLTLNYCYLVKNGSIQSPVKLSRTFLIEFSYLIYPTTLVTGFYFLIF